MRLILSITFTTLFLFSCSPETSGNNIEMTENKLNNTSPQNNLNPFLEGKLNSRKTINLVRPWNPDLGLKKFGLAWTRDVQFSKKTITLRHLNWNYNKVGMKDAYYPGIDKFLTSKPFFKENKLLVEVDNPDYQNFFAKLVNSKIKELDNASDGVMLDWWNDNQPIYKGNKQTLNKARRGIAKAVREEIGLQKIILANVNGNKDKGTVQYLNGVFFELSKSGKHKNSKELYTKSDYFMIEDLLEFYQENLQHPKLIALEGWKEGYSDSSQNVFTQRIAKTLTAMTIVIADNGYVNFATNHPDYDEPEYEFYEFYDFDIGQPISESKKLRTGVQLKEHERGFVAYNITGSEYSFARKSQEIIVPKYSGLFCMEIDGLDCLSVD